MPVFPCGGKVRLAALGEGKWLWGGAFLVGALWGAPEASFGQENPALVDWKDSWFAKNRPGVGTNFSYDIATDPPTYTATNAQLSDALLPETIPANSGYDWFEAHANVYDTQAPFAQTGVVAVGFFSWANWMATPNASVPLGQNGTPYPDASGMQTFEHRHFYQSRACVVMYDMQGIMLWWKPLQMGRFFGVAFDPAGYIVTTGQTEWGFNLADMQPGVLPILYNPTVGQATVTLPTVITRRQMTVSKFDLAGNALWCHAFNTPALPADAAAQVSEGADIALVNNNGTTGYRVVGFAKADAAAPPKPFVVDLDNNGFLVNDAHRRLLSDVPGFSASGVGDSRAMSIGRLPVPGGDKFAISGWRSTSSNYDAWLLLIDDALSPSDPLNPPGGFKFLSNSADHALLEEFVPFNEALNSNSSSVEYAANGDLIWPVLVDYTPTTDGIFDSPLNREARAVVHRIDWSGTTPDLLWSTDMKAVRAYNIQADAVVKPNGDIAFASTKWQAPFTLANPLTYAWLSANEPAFVQNCLNHPNAMGYDQNHLLAGIQPYNWSAYPYSFWNTNLYCALLRGGTGSLVWHGTYDDVEGATRECAPLRVKQKECVFSVSTADDGDIVMSGTSSDNFDDCYVVKLSPSCDAKADYSYFETNYPFNSPVGNPNNQYALTASATWTNVSMNVRGSIIVPAGRTLTLTNCNLRFADSRKMGYTCNIVVQPQGKLFLNNTTLTSLANCPESMWDGIRVLGTNAGDSPSVVGELRVLGGSTISNALAGATNCEVDPMNPSTAVHSAKGGMIRVEDSFFLNNRFDVVLRPFNFGTNAEVNANSRFYNSQFGTTAFLNYPNQSPQTHLWIESVRRIRVGSCQFYNNASLSWPVENWGTGIRSINTPLQVAPMCSGNNWDPNCATANITTAGTFSNLLRGVDYSTNNPLTCLVRLHLFDRCAGGVRLTNSINAVVKENFFVVPDVYTLSAGFPAAYGFGVWGGTGFHLKNNHLNGIGPINIDPPNVGAIFDQTGLNNNRYENNTFDKFTYGTIIQGINGSNAPDDGLDLKCNDYGTTQALGWNQYDVVFGGFGPTVGSKQGAPGSLSSPAGNTFSAVCASAETQMFVPNLSVNTFEYWHHAANPNYVLKPTCRTNPPIADGWLFGALTQYSKEQSCPGYIAMVGNGSSQQSRMAEAQQQHNGLKLLYDAQRDGGATDLLKLFVLETAHSSADVRNALMAAAPKVSVETWKEVFGRAPALNPWHLAQALQANSPLQPEVMRMMEESDLTPFYKQLVLGVQNGGVSSLSIFEAEMTQWKQQHADALKRLVAAAVMGEEEVTVDDALVFEAQYPQIGTPWARIQLRLAQGDLAAAKAIVDAQNAVPEPEGTMEVLGMALALEQAGSTLHDASAEQLDRLHTLADGEGTGMFAAQAWLRAIDPWLYPERILLPHEMRAMAASEADDAANTETEQLLSVYPNPSNGEGAVYAVARMMEGMESGEVSIYDPIGKLLLRQRVQGRSAIVELPVRDLPPGLYVATLHADGVQVGSLKFEITAR